MTAFRILLAALFIGVLIYTLMVFTHADLGLFEQFGSDVKAKNWAGQFNLDFLSFIALVVSWILWRHQFKPVGFLCALGVCSLGILFLAPYVLVSTFKANGDMRALMLGPDRSAT